MSKLFCGFSVLVSLILCGCGSGTYTVTNQLPVVAFSDIHFNPFDDGNLFTRLDAADPSQWENIFKTTTKWTPATWGQDTNYPSLVLAMASIKQNVGASPMVIFTGDLLGHNFNTIFYQQCKCQDQAAMNTFADKTLAFVMLQINASVGNIPVMFAVGNWDSYNGAGPNSTFLANTADLYYTNFLKGTADQQEFLSTFKSGGYYSAQPLGTGLMVIALNTNLFALGIPANPSAVQDELAWFDAKLADAQIHGKKVWLLMHVPPGADTFTTAQNAASNGQISSATMMWTAQDQAAFLLILAKYPGVITSSMAAHTHMDDFRVLSPSNVLEISPSISPSLGNNPAYRIFTLTRSTFSFSDYRSLNYDLVTKPAQFNDEYTFSTEYSLQGPLNHSLQQLSSALFTDPVKQAVYRSHYYSGHNAAPPVLGSNPITDTNWPVFGCGIQKSLETELVLCADTH